MINDLPVFGICGFSGSGKTTLIERVLPLLAAGGLSVAVVKHDAHGLAVDRPGKDSDRFYQAGADVLLQGPGEELLRAHRQEASIRSGAVGALAERYDLILVEGHKATPLPKVWLTGADGASAPADVEHVVATLGRDDDRTGRLVGILEDFARGRWLAAPLYGCVLIGGQSRRMGRAKHLIEVDGRTWLQRTVELVGRECERVIIAGAGDVPEALAAHIRLPDVPGAAGPMAGILAAMRWAPTASLLVTACDQPDLTGEALTWLLSARRPGAWAVLGKLAGSDRADPLPGLYNSRCRHVLEQLAARGDYRLRRIADHPKVLTRPVPPALAAAWRNLNTPEDLRRPEP